MRYVSEMTESELITMESAYKNHPSVRVRIRAQMIILSNKDYNVQEIADICQMTRQTVSTVISRWEEFGLIGLYDKPRPGKPRVLTVEDEKFIFDMVEQEPHSIDEIISCLEDQRGKKVSKSTIKRVLKKN